ncbi:MAG: Fe-S-binding domain-containing protein, partial [Cytophagales bacterium]|nr:Fe-S-binding domain-containing protein [Cytophaga sp.]
VWLSDNKVFRVTGRKDKYGELEEWICNDCRFDKKEVTDWVIDGPRMIDRHSVISLNKYAKGIKQVEAPKTIGYGNTR